MNATKEELRAELGAASVELRQMQSRAEAAEQRHRLSDRLRHEAESECAALRIACEASDDIRKQVMNSNEKLRAEVVRLRGLLDTEKRCTVINVSEKHAAEVECAALRDQLELVATGTVTQLSGEINRLRTEVERLRRSEGKAWDEARAAAGGAKTARRARERQTASYRAAESECAALRAALTSHKGMLRNLSDEGVIQYERAEKLESECATLRAAVREKEQLELAACAEADELRASLAAATELLARIVKYAIEDKARTPGTTRLARALNEVKAFLATQPAAPSLTELTVLVHDDGSIKRVIEEPAAIRDLGTLDIDDGLDEPESPARTRKP
jgi:chromosome segregation ATPase